MIDIGLLVVRIVLGGLLAAHGLQKLTGWFGGPGIDGHAEFLRGLGYRRPRGMAWLHATAETGAGLMLAFGAFTPLAVAAIIAVMLNAAVVVHARNGLWVHQGGYEYPLVLGATAATLALTGPGGYAIDRLAGWQTAPGWAVAAIGLGLIAGVAALAMRQRVPVHAEPSAGSGTSGDTGLPTATA